MLDGGVGEVLAPGAIVHQMLGAVERELQTHNDGC